MTRIAAAFAVACALAPAIACAQPLADPTRPPNATATAEAAEGPGGGPRLESVLIAPNRRVAVINGKTVPLHGTYDGRRVVRITESEVELRDGAGSEILKLFPNVDKQARAGRVRRTLP